MIPKVHRMDRLTREGFELSEMDVTADGSIRIVLTRGGDTVHLVFEHWEVPAVVTQAVTQGFAS